MKIQEVIDCVLTDSTGETRIAPTCDQLMTPSRKLRELPLHLWQR